MDTLTFSRGHVQHNVFIKIIFAMPRRKPFFLWKIEFGNHGSSPIVLKDIVLFSVNGGHPSGISFTRSERSRLAFYSNGWQSWSRTAVYGEDEVMWQTNVRLFQGPQWINRKTPTPRRKGHYASDFFAVIGDRESRLGWVLGFLSQRRQFGVITAALGKRREIQMFADGDDILMPPGMKVETDWAIAAPVRVDDRDPLGEFIDAVARENDIHLTKAKPVGWSSWYEFYTKIDEVKLRRNLDAIAANQKFLPIGLFQIDDGYESQVGDWLTFHKNFPAGVKPFADACRENGLKAGLWQAPFIVHPWSRLAREHPDWLLRTRIGGLANTGFNWNVFTTALDLTHPQAIGYVKKVTETAVKNWGFNFLKLDFLYSAAISGKHKDPSKTRAQVISHAMKTIRDAAGDDVFLLGCGAPIGSMLGWVDGMRIGADMFEHWITKVLGATWLLRHEANAPSVRNAIQNIITRAMFHNRWWINDPDVLLVRDKMELTLDEIHSTASMIAMTGGMLMLSDNLPGLTPERVRIATQLVPPLDQRAWVLDWFDRQTPCRLRLDMEGVTGMWWLISYSNWSDGKQDAVIAPEEYRLPADRYIARSFWDGSIHQFSEKDPLVLKNVAPHCTVLLAVRQYDPKSALYLGSDMHISQGQELSRFTRKGHSLELCFDIPKSMSGSFDVYSPDPVISAGMGKTRLQVRKIQAGVYRIALNVDRNATIKLEF